MLCFNILKLTFLFICYIRDESKRLLEDTMTTLYSNSNAVINCNIVFKGKTCNNVELP